MSFRGCRRSTRLPDRKTVLRERSPGTKGLGKREVVRRLHGLGLSIHDDPAIQAEGLAVVARFLAFVRAQPCAVTGWRTGERHEHDGAQWIIHVEAAHLGSRGSFAGDIGNAVAITDFLHRHLHAGVLRGVTAGDLEQRARAVALAFLAAHLDDARWLLEHANDGDVVALAREVVG